MKIPFFNPADRAARGELRQAIDALEEHGKTEWAKATAGLPWYRRMLFELDEDPRYHVLNEAVAVTEARLPRWQWVLTRFFMR